MSGMKILIISEYIAPVQHIAAIRWTKYAKYLAKDHGCKVTVLTNEKCFDGSSMTKKQYSYDSSLAEDMLWFRTCFIPKSISQTLANVMFSLGYRTLRRLQSRTNNQGSSSSISDGAQAHTSGVSPLASLMKLLVSLNIPEKVFDFADRNCGEAYIAAGKKSSLDFSSFDIVISSHGPVWTHLLAKEIKAAYPALFWIADFRDAIIYSERSKTERNMELTKSIVECADCVTAVSAGCAENLFIPRNKPWFVVFNGYDPEELTAGGRKQSEYFDLVYTGTLYSDGDAERDLSPLFRAVDECISEGAIDRAKVRFVYAGGSSLLFQQFAREYHQVPSLDLGLLSRSDALSLQEQGSALVVANWNTSIVKGGLSGKIFEYLCKDVPIIGLVSGDVPHSALRNLIEDSNAGVCYEESDSSTYQRLKDYVASLYKSWIANGVTTRGEASMQCAGRYSYPNLAESLLQYIESIMTSREA